MADHDVNENDRRPDPAGGSADAGRDDAPASPDRAGQPVGSGHGTLQEAIDESIGSAAAGPGA